MGWSFPVEYSNIVAYITTPEPHSPLLLKHRDLGEFLNSLQDDLKGRTRLISSDPDWIPAVKDASRKASEILRRSVNPESNEPLPQAVIKQVLHSLERLLGNYKFFGMAVGTRNDFEGVATFATEAAIASKHHAIFLIPQVGDRTSLFECSIPFRPISLLAEQPETWPGILFWTKTGAAAFADVRQAELLLNRLIEASGVADRPGPIAELLDRILKSFRPEKKSKSILHLSDLHFGPDIMMERQSYLLAHLNQVVQSVDRIVITGDLFNNPRSGDAFAFNSFRDSLKRMTKKDIIVVPGNHDSKLMGNSFKFIGRHLEQLANLEWKNLVVDDDIRCVFFCFDSSLNGDWARGRITSGQTLRMATDFENEWNSNPELHNYHAIALIHHHPFSFEAAQETRLQKVLAFLGHTEERYLRMVNAQPFLNWCAKRDVPLILHGHKHVPKHMNQEITFMDGKERMSRTVTAIGCGSSLGAEDSPMSYNVLRWNPSNGRWSAAFFADANDGSGFIEQYVSVRAQEAWSDNIWTMNPPMLRH